MWKKLFLVFILLIIAVTTRKYYILVRQKPIKEVTMSENNYQKVHVKVANTSVVAEYADTLEKQILGLGGRSSLGENEGMLFPQDKTNEISSFWMKGMLIPIDIIWINDEKIIQIDKNAQPEKAETPENMYRFYRSISPVTAVLEVRSGFCDKNNIKVGVSVVVSYD
jgi:uncharacterized protein